MTALLVALGALNTILTILKAIPATAAIADEISAVETAVQNAVTAGQAAAKQSGEDVDPSLLLPITLVA